jgi:hypothetical protein
MLLQGFGELFCAEGLACRNLELDDLTCRHTTR